MAPVGITRRVLFPSGDARPGGNDLGSEAACIRQALVGSLVQVSEMAAFGLAEICRTLDDHAPRDPSPRGAQFLRRHSPGPGRK
ncbi:hypothetical protein SSP531S_15920 [Streptomyces spongiicola]|uniref:Uncharacterized protein n=1 Tax=Streptomyces spongiicola TaxID=1690221 RepID=A0A388SU72_9ACTN|nr:hypothetical protein SSP531S_15920 [Streptomyces spongiicola]